MYLSEKEINEFIKGLGLKFDGEIAQGQDTEKEQIESKISSDLLAQNQPYDSQLEISANELTFDHKCPIGSGQFGTVLKATFKRPEPSLTVAVKTAKPNLNAQYLRTLLKEVKIMMYVGQHPKIVGLLGCCTANLRKGELFLVLEYCENGSLEKFLKANRARFVNIVEKGILHAEKCAASDYLKILLGLELPTPLQSDSTDIFDIYRLITWSIEIAEGMEYLATKKVVHGDLSARNVLVTADGKAKVADFGLSRTIYHYTHYAKNGREPLPWRWMALESLKNSSFSTASDVWSFGVLMWEIFTLAEQPYPGVSSLTSNFVQNLEQGLRPTFPPFATSEIYNIMSCCWDEDPKRRPLFSRLLCSLMEIQSECREKTSRRPSSDSDYFE
ncbi:Tyrosine-protein kinase transforming protein kit [Orchesella cincta]|uniref:Tyrosine-protein kinase transforming protein kit n=1 Tax=Orchesella cincta TaxID=48709 RepID=A0A1D2MX24_ORCCI|nr:Tyrosine-protein kinase transforming protein kit [Orchesella cincta]